MTVIAPPLAWTINATSIKPPIAEFHFEANAVELDALKHYLDIEEVKAFKADLKVARSAEGKFQVTGNFAAEVHQASVITLGKVASYIAESFSVQYWPAELIPEMPETGSPFEDAPEAIADGRLAVGALLCELLAVAVDPYPRNEEDAFEWSEGSSESEAGPFAKLKELRGKGEKT